MVLIILSFGIFLTFVNIYELRQLQSDHMTSPLVEGHLDSYKQPIVWVEAKNVSDSMIVESLVLRILFF